MTSSRNVEKVYREQRVGRGWRKKENTEKKERKEGRVERKARQEEYRMKESKERGREDKGRKEREEEQHKLASNHSRFGFRKNFRDFSLDEREERTRAKGGNIKMVVPVSQ